MKKPMPVHPECEIERDACWLAVTEDERFNGKHLSNAQMNAVIERVRAEARAAALHEAADYIESTFPGGKIVADNVRKFATQPSAEKPGDKP